VKCFKHYFYYYYYYFYAKIPQISQIADFVSNCLAMATMVGCGKILLTAFNCPTPIKGSNSLPNAKICKISVIQCESLSEINKTEFLNDNDFLVRMLYKYSY